MNSDLAVRMRNVSSGYSKIKVLRDVELEVSSGDVLGIFGANGAGKTTLLRTISRMTTLSAGSITMWGTETTRLRPPEISRMRVAHVPEGRRVFRGMSVEDNLLVAARRGRRKSRLQLTEVYDLFPRLRERDHQAAESLSGGEQQMLAIGRALMMNPRLIMFDEPSQGLSPVAVQLVTDSITRIAERGITVIIVEQNVQVLLPIVSRVAIVSRGSVSELADINELGSAESLSDLLGGGPDQEP